MPALDINKLINKTNDDEIKCMLYNIDVYKDMKEYTHYTNNTREDLKELQDDGWVMDITPGTYNGALDKTDYSELTTENIYSVLLEDVHEDSFQELLKDEDEYNASEARKVRLVTEFYKVFTIGQHLYIDYDQQNRENRRPVGRLFIYLKKSLTKL